MNSDLVQQLRLLEGQAQQQGEQYRALAFSRAQQVLATLPYQITEPSQLRNLPGIGAGIERRLTEYLQTGQITELGQLSQQQPVLDLFQSVYGVGPVVAQRWYQQGYRTLADVQSGEAGNLTHLQQLGLTYYQDLQQPIPREEASQIIQWVQDFLTYVNESMNDHQLAFEAIPAGSYRRGAAFSNDLDLLIVERSGQALPSQWINWLVASLQQQGLLVATIGLGPVKFMGLAQLSPQYPVRRIDFELVDNLASLPYALLYFTGSKNFNRLMRQRAKELGLLLNHQGLFQGSLAYPAQSEEDIFTALGLTYVPPDQR